MNQSIYETPEYQWLLEVTNVALKDVGGRAAADMNLLVAMCASEPKSAQFAIQLLAQDLIAETGSPDWVESSDPTILTLQFELGAIAMAYIVSRRKASDGEIPPEVESMAQYSLIVQAMNAINPPT